MFLSHQLNRLETFGKTKGLYMKIFLLTCLTFLSFSARGNFSLRLFLYQILSTTSIPFIVKQFL